MSKVEYRLFKDTWINYYVKYVNGEFIRTYKVNTSEKIVTVSTCNKVDPGESLVLREEKCTEEDYNEIRSAYRILTKNQYLSVDDKYFYDFIRNIQLIKYDDGKVGLGVHDLDPTTDKEFKYITVEEFDELHKLYRVPKYFTKKSKGEEIFIKEIDGNIVGILYLRDKEGTICSPKGDEVFEDLTEIDQTEYFSAVCKISSFSHYDYD